jgi:hypothetical protein
VDERFYYISEGRIEEDSFVSIQPSRANSFIRFVKNKLQKMTIENVKNEYNRNNLKLKGNINIDDLNIDFNII